MGGAIFLAGGGVSEQSAKVDAAFVAGCDLGRPLIYIPNAMRAQPPDASLSWFSSLMAPHQVREIEMWDHLEPQRSPDAIAGVYISGGDTAHLLDELQRKGFDQYLAAVLASGKPIYGQSAGAIVLGECLATSPAAIAAGRGESPGLRLIPGHAIACHYRLEDDDRLSKVGRDNQLTVIAISEDAGALIEAGGVKRIGGAPVTIFHPDGRRSTA